MSFYADRNQNQRTTMSDHTYRQNHNFDHAAPVTRPVNRTQPGSLARQESPRRFSARSARALGLAVTSLLAPAAAQSEVERTQSPLMIPVEGIDPTLVRTATERINENLAKLDRKGWTTWSHDEWEQRTRLAVQKEIVQAIGNAVRDRAQAHDAIAAVQREIEQLDPASNAAAIDRRKQQLSQLRTRMQTNTFVDLDFVRGSISQPRGVRPSMAAHDLAVFFADVLQAPESFARPVDRGFRVLDSYLDKLRGTHGRVDEQLAGHVSGRSKMQDGKVAYLEGLRTKLGKALSLGRSASDLQAFLDGEASAIWTHESLALLAREARKEADIGTAVRTLAEGDRLVPGKHERFTVAVEGFLSCRTERGQNYREVLHLARIVDALGNKVHLIDPRVRNKQAAQFQPSVVYSWLGEGDGYGLVFQAANKQRRGTRG